MAGLGSRLRRTLALLVASVLAVATLAGCTETRITSSALTLEARNHRVLALLDPAAPRPPGTVSLAEVLSAELPSAEVVQTPSHEDQIARVGNAGPDGVGVLLVQAVDAQRIGAALETAQDDGVLVIAVDVFPADLDGVDLFLGWDEFSIGEQEIAALAARFAGAEGTQHLEFFAGSQDDPRAMARFNGAMLALKPFNRDGLLTVKSGQTSFGTAAVEPGDLESPRKRLTTTYRATYPRHELAAVVIPDDALAPVVRQVAVDAQHEAPLLLSSGASADGVRAVMDGSMQSTQYRDPARLAGLVARTVTTVVEGGELDWNPQSSRRNRLRSKPGILTSPVLVTAQNAAEVLASNPELAPLTKA